MTQKIQIGDKVRVKDPFGAIVSEGVVKKMDKNSVTLKLTKSNYIIGPGVGDLSKESRTRRFFGGDRIEKLKRKTPKKRRRSKR